MKKSIILFALLISMITNVYSQSGSSYYMPLCIGNYASFNTPQSGDYGGRKTNYHIKQSDLVVGQIAYLQEAYEIGDNSPNDTSIFQQIWLRKDASGNILMVAINVEGTGLLADAMILPVAHRFIPNEYLTLGYTRSYVFGDQTTYDTVMSISANVGSYNNCIVVRETIVSDQSVEKIDEYYYAPSAGIVKMQRLYNRDEPQFFTASLTNILNYDCYVGLQDNEFIDGKTIKVYPNPASGIVNLEINNVNKEVLTLNIYNIIGSLVKRETIRHEKNQVSVGDLLNGIYLIEIRSNDSSQRQKLIIQNNNSK